MTTPDAWPTIPTEEYPERWRKVQRLMEQQNLDFLVAYADDRAVFGPAHARWLANFPVHFEPVCILMRREGPPTMLCGPESDEYARIAGRVSDVRVLREFTHPNEDYPFSRIQSLAEILAETTPNPRSIHAVGWAGQRLMSGSLVSEFHDSLMALTGSSHRETLPGPQWVDVENALCDLRAVKSPAELAVICYAYKIAEAGFAAAIEAIRPGVTERAVAAEAESAMRRMGAEGTGIDTIVASGSNARPILARSTFRRVEADDSVLLTVAPRYEGYHAAIGRLVLVGHPADEISRAVEVAWQAQEACFAAMRPGVAGRDVEAVGRRIVEDAGLGQYFLYSGLHSVGVIEFEPPIFGPSSTATLQPGMVISVDIPMFNAPWGGLRVEDGFIITETGAERLHRTPYRIQK